MTKTKCKITISRPNFSSGKEAINITITDVTSGTEFFDGEMTLEDFTRCLTGFGLKPIEAELRLENVGKIAENKEVEVPAPDNWYQLSDAEKKNLIKPFEIDGWEAHISDYGNNHRRTKAGFRVVFFRFVDPPKGTQ